MTAPHTPMAASETAAPVSSAGVPGPQPGFAPDYQSNMQYQQAPQGQYPQQAGYDQFNHQGYAGGPPVRPYGQAPIQPPQIPRPTFNVPWTTGLLDCCDDPSNAFITFCVPCVTFGQVAEIIDQGSSSCATHATLYSCVWFLIGCPCLLSCSYRTKLRAKYELMETPAPDWLTHFVCELCALCQMHRELVNRGLDPAIGWLANVQRMQQQQMQPMAPPSHQAMM